MKGLKGAKVVGAVKVRILTPQSDQNFQYFCEISERFFWFSGLSRNSRIHPRRETRAYNINMNSGMEYGSRARG